MLESESPLAATFVRVADETAPDGYAFIGAVHTLVTSKASGTKSDLILAAACQALRDSDKTESEIRLVVDHIWPGARTDIASIRLSLNLGLELGLLRRETGLEDVQLWSLTPQGVEDVDRQVDWVRVMRERTRDELINRARLGLLIEVPSETADLWMEQLVRALIDGIQSSQDAYFGRVDQVVGKRLVPRGIDQKRVFARLEDSRVTATTSDFLKAAAVSAFDPLDPFGNELISLITTGCVLHSYVAGRDASAALAKLGAAAGQRALIDTPVLVDLIGPQRVSSNAAFVISTALKAGWEVVVCEHSLDELSNLMEREIPKIKRSFADAHARGVKEEWYAALVYDQLPTYCVEILRDGTYVTLEQMAEAARTLTTRLEQMGVIVRPHGNDHEPTYVDRALRALEGEFTRLASDKDSNGGRSGRSPAAIERDADSMVVVWRRRRRQVGTTWPGGWIISSDRRISPAYRALEPTDSVPLTLPMARWSALLSVTVAPAEVVELAAAAATQLVEEAMWLLPSRFPSSVAMDLARQLSPEQGGSELDFRYAQLTLDDSLDNLGNSRSAASLAGDVMAARAKRTTSIHAHGLNEAKAQQAAAETEALRANAIAANEASRASSADERARAADKKAAALSLELDWAKKRTTRAVVSILIVAMAAVVLYVSILVDAPTWGRGAAGLALISVTIGGFRWSTNREAKFVPIIVGAAFEAAALLVTLIDLAFVGLAIP